MSGVGEQPEEGARREHGNLPLKAEKVFVTRHESRTMRGCEDNQVVIVGIMGANRRIAVWVEDDARTAGKPAHQVSGVWLADVWPQLWIGERPL